MEYKKPNLPELRTPTGSVYLFQSFFYLRQMVVKIVLLPLICCFLFRLYTVSASYRIPA